MILIIIIIIIPTITIILLLIILLILRIIITLIILVTTIMIMLTSTPMARELTVHMCRCKHYFCLYRYRNHQCRHYFGSGAATSPTADLLTMATTTTQHLQGLLRLGLGFRSGFGFRV